MIAILFGMGFGGRNPLTVAIRGDYFGRATFAKILGLSTVPSEYPVIGCRALRRFHAECAGDLYQCPFDPDGLELPWWCSVPDGQAAGPSASDHAACCGSNRRLIRPTEIFFLQLLTKLTAERTEMVRQAHHERLGSKGTLFLEPVEGWDLCGYFRGSLKGL